MQKFTLRIILSLFVAVSICSSLAAAAQPYALEADRAVLVASAKINFTGVASGPLLENVRNNVALFQRIKTRSKKNPLSMMEWERLQAVLEQQVLQAVKPYGYYNASVSRKQSGANLIVYQIELGKPVVLDQVSVSITGELRETPSFQAWQGAHRFVRGEVLDQQKYEQAKKSLAHISQSMGFFEGSMDQHRILINEARTAADLTLSYHSGPRFQFGDYRIVWRNPEHESVYSDQLIQGFINFNKGEPFDGRLLTSLQSRLSSSPFFSFVQVSPLRDQSSDQQVPIQIVLEASLRHAYGSSVGYGTDTGPRLGLNYNNRRLNQRGHRLNTNLYYSEEKQNLVSNYHIPRLTTPGEGTNLFASYSQEDSEARELTNFSVGFDVLQSFDDWRWTYGISYRDEQFVESGVRQDAGLLMPSISLQLLRSSELDSTGRGMKIVGTLRGAHEDVLADVSFIQILLNSKAVKRFGGGTILARAQLSHSVIDGEQLLPASLRFLAGGDHTIRGYAYESIGVLNSDGSLRGGENLLAASLEYEHQIRGPLAIAAFVDVGDAFDDSMSLKKGVGAGLRWRLPFGALKVDLASGLDLEGDPLRLHITFGTDL